MQNKVQQDDIEKLKNDKQSKEISENQLDIGYQEVSKCDKEKLFRQSPFTNKYKTEFFNIEKQTKQNKALFEFTSYQERFKKYNVTYTPQRPIATSFTLYKIREQMKGRIKNYIAKFSYFSVQISIYNEVDDKNFDISLLYENFITSGSFGNICSYDAEIQQGPSRLIIKLLKFNQAPWQIIYSAIKEYAFMKVLAALRIGPELRSPFGFDIVTTENYALFSMEKGIPIESFSKNLHGNKQIPKPYFDKLQQDLKVLHFLSIVHVDIKPENIIYSPTFKKLVFIDFGLSQALRLPIGTLQLVTFSGSFFYCSQQMKKLFTQGSYGYIDMYYNDFQCWKNTKQCIEADQNKKNLPFSLELIKNSESSFQNDQLKLISLKSPKKNAKLQAYFQKINIVYLVHTNIRGSLEQKLLESQNLKLIFSEDNQFFQQLIETYDLNNEFFLKFPIVENKTIAQNNFEDIEVHSSIENKYQDNDEQSQQNSTSRIESEKMIKFRYSNDFLETGNPDEMINNLKFQKIRNENYCEDDCFNYAQKTPLKKLKELVLKTIINQFDFLRGITKKSQEIHNYLLETMKLVLNEEETRKIEALSLKNLVQYCLNFTVQQILSFLEQFSVHEMLYHFITQEITPTQNILKFAKTKILPQASSTFNSQHSYKLSFFYDDLEKYIVFVINRFQAQSIFQEGYLSMEKVKANFNQKIMNLKKCWQDLDSQFFDQTKKTKDYMQSQIIKTYVKQSLLRCSYFYCKLTSQMCFFAHQKQNLSKMEANLMDIKKFIQECEKDCFFKAMLLQQPVFIQYSNIMKIMYALYILPNSSYRQLNIKSKIQSNINALNLIQQQFRKDQYRYIYFILLTIYIQLLASQNMFTDLFMVLEKCFEIVRYWRCEYLFVNTITIMARFHNDEIISRAEKYLQHLRKNLFSSVNSQSSELNIDPKRNNFLLKKQKNSIKTSQRQKFGILWQEHLIRISMICNFQKIYEISREILDEFFRPIWNQRKIQKFDNKWAAKYTQVLNKVEQNTIIQIERFQQNFDKQKIDKISIFRNKEDIELTIKALKLTKQLTLIQFILFHYRYMETDVILHFYERLKLIEQANDPFCCKFQDNQNTQNTTQYLDVIYIKIVFLSFLESNQQSITQKIINEDIQNIRNSKMNFKKAFQIECFINRKNNLTYLSTYVKIVNEKTLYLQMKVNPIYISNVEKKKFLAKKIQYDQLCIYFKKLENIFFYMNGLENINSKTIGQNYIALIFTLKEQYVQMCLNICKYYTELIQQKILTYNKQSSKKGQGKNLNQPLVKRIQISLLKKKNSLKAQFQDLNINFKDEIERIFFFFEKLTVFTNKYSCRNYSQFIFGIVKNFVSSYTKMKIQLSKSLDLPELGTQIKQKIFTQLQRQLLQKIEFLIFSQKFNSFQYGHHQSEYSKNQKQFLNFTSQNINQQKNRQIIFVCFLLLKILVEKNPKKVLKLTKRIISKQIKNLYSHSRELIKQNIEALVISIWESTVSKFNEKGTQSGISYKEYEKFRRKILFYRQKSQKNQKIDAIMKQKFPKQTKKQDKILKIY